MGVSRVQKSEFNDHSSRLPIKAVSVCTPWTAEVQLCSPAFYAGRMNSLYALPTGIFKIPDSNFFIVR